MKKWYCVPHANIIDSYNVEGNLTDFPRGVFLAYNDCCLTTGFNTKKEAREWMEAYPCNKYNNSHISELDKA